MTDPFATPFPGRPDHADFRRLSEIVIAQDTKADSGVVTPDNLGDYLAPMIDPTSVRYMATNRARMRLHGLLSAGEVTAGDLVATLAGGWLDGFTAGWRFRDGAPSGVAGDGRDMIDLFNEHEPTTEEDERGDRR